MSYEIWTQYFMLSLPSEKGWSGGHGSGGEGLVSEDEGGSEERMGGLFVSKKYSKYRGVGITCPTERWQARICFQGRRIFLGTFDTEKAAAKAYIRAERRFYGGEK